MGVLLYMVCERLPCWSPSYKGTKDRKAIGVVDRFPDDTQRVLDWAVAGGGGARVLFLVAAVVWNAVHACSCCVFPSLVWEWTA